jgi:pimeloyl-ACP methyl ester carboxylesterase
MDWKARLPAILLIICVLGYLLSLTQLYGAYAGIDRVYHDGTAPVLELVPSDPVGTVVLAHGFCADKEMMQPMGLALARNGYRVILFDSPGHGASPLRMNDTNLTDVISQVSATYAGDNFSIAGHSMGSLVIQYAMGGKPLACIGISPIFGAVNATSPGNLLLIAGSADLDGVKTTAAAALKNGTGGDTAGFLYGDFSNGTARKLVVLDGDNHISILYDGRAYEEMLGWLDASYGVKRNVGYNSDGGVTLWFMLCAIFTIAAFFPVASFLSARMVPAGFELKAPDLGTWKPALLMLISALVAAAIIYLTGTPPIGILLGDTVSVFLLYMGIVGLGLFWLFFREPLEGIKTTFDRVFRPLALAIMLLLFIVIFLGIPSSASVYGLIPGTARILFMALMGLMIFPYSLSSELAFRGIPGGRSLAEGMVMRVVTIAILTAAALLSNGGFLIVILPVLLPLFVFLEIMSFYIYRRTGNVLAGAVLNSLIAAWLMAAAFPLV